MKIPVRTELDIHQQPGQGSNEWKIERIRQWQTCGMNHPLTCAGYGCRSVLDADEIENEVVLICPDCGYVQIYIPYFVFHASLETGKLLYFS